MSDYISREAAVKIAQKYGLTNGSALGRHSGLADCIAIEIEGLPAADVEPVRHGRWEGVPNAFVSVASKDGSYHGNATTCSACHEVNPNAYKTNFCPICGAKMDLEDENDE